MMSKPRWKKFEELVAVVQKRLSPNAVVKHDDKIVGKKSGTPRQIDVSIRDIIGEFDILIVIECRDQKTPVGIPDIEQFATKVLDVGAHKGAIISASGYTSTAPEYAKAVGLNLYRLIDVGEHVWKSFVSVPVLCDFRSISDCRFKFNTEPSNAQYINEIMRQEEDQRNIVLYDKKFKGLGRIVEFMNRKLQEAKSLVSPGQHDVVFPNDVITMKFKDRYLEVRVGIKYSITSELRLGFLPLEEFSGLQDVVAGGVITDGFTTSSLDIHEAWGKWQKIDTMDKLVIRPLITLTVIGSL